MIIFKKYFLTVGEQWFSKNDLNKSVDLIVFKNIYTRNKTNKATIILDLNSFSNDIQNLKSSLRYDIRQGMKLNAKLISKSDISYESYLDMYFKFLKENGIAILKNKSIKQLKTYYNSKSFIVSATSIDDTIYTIHSYIANIGKARLMHSFHNIKIVDRKTLGYVNKYHHWHDIVNFKNTSYEIYDWGGYHLGNDEKLLSINKFKQNFGGELTNVYDEIVPNSIKGIIAMKIKRILKL